MTEHCKIYVRLPEEAVDVWRPVEAEHLFGDVYRIVPQRYDRDVESWQFEPGDRVVCELITVSEGQILAATRKA